MDSVGDLNCLERKEVASVSQMGEEEVLLLGSRTDCPQTLPWAHWHGRRRDL